MTKSFPRSALALAVLFCLAAARADEIGDKAVVCAACHGERGAPIGEEIPSLWGQNEGYIYIELRDMKKGARNNEQMAAIVEGLSRDDMFALAAYFAAKPWVGRDQPRASADDVARFDAMARSAGCPGCHQAGYIGAGTQPRIAGQGYDYLVKTMLDFRSGARANNSWMTDLLKTYSEDDIRLMARVLAGM